MMPPERESRPQQEAAPRSNGKKLKPTVTRLPQSAEPIGGW